MFPSVECNEIDGNYGPYGVISQWFGMMTWAMGMMFFFFFRNSFLTHYTT